MPEADTYTVCQDFVDLTSSELEPFGDRDCKDVSKKALSESIHSLGASRRVKTRWSSPTRNIWVCNPHWPSGTDPYSMSVSRTHRWRCQVSTSLPSCEDGDV